MTVLSYVAFGAAIAIGVSGCTLTAAKEEENREVAMAIASLDPADYGTPPGGTPIDCVDVPWLGEDLAGRSVWCWSVPLDDDQVRDTAIAIATDLALTAGGQFVGEVCGDVDGVEVQCASFASMPEARDANVEIWVALDDEAVEALEPGTSAGEYFVTFRLVAYGPELYESGSAPTATIERYSPTDG